MDFFSTICAIWLIIMYGSTFVEYYVYDILKYCLTYFRRILAFWWWNNIKLSKNSCEFLKKLAPSTFFGGGPKIGRKSCEISYKSYLDLAEYLYSLLKCYKYFKHIFRWLKTFKMAKIVKSAPLIDLWENISQCIPFFGENTKLYFGRLVPLSCKSCKNTFFFMIEKKNVESFFFF